MPLRKRLIARLDIKGSRLIKGVRFEGLRVLGDPIAFAQKYASLGIDELLFTDAVASLYGRNSLIEILRCTSRHVFVPITAGGAIRSVEDARVLLSSGADKIAINTAAILRPALIRELSEAFGSQCVVLSVQARRTSSSSWEAMTEAGRERSGRDVMDWIQEVQELGAGEILVTSVDQDGTLKGPDYLLVNQISDICKVPLIVGGGFSTTDHISTCLTSQGVSAISIGAALHRNALSLEGVRHDLSLKGFQVPAPSSSSDFIKPTFPLPKTARIGIVDYGMGNHQSLLNALDSLNFDTILTDSWDSLSSCDLLFLPGVGSFPEAMRQLYAHKHINRLSQWVDSGLPLIGICLGMQLLFEKSDEFTETNGLSFIPGHVKRLTPSLDNLISSFPVPHIGLNDTVSSCPSIQTSSQYYFVHSYSACNVPDPCILSTCSYGDQTIVSSVKHNSLLGFQFHPELSGQVGVKLLSSAVNFLLDQ